MARGPKALPKNVHKLRGTPAPGRQQEPEVELGEPPVPPWLSDAAKVHWLELVPIGLEMRSLAKTDGPMLALLCECLVDYLASRTASAAARTQSLMGEFGLSPAARAKVKVIGGEKAKGYGGFRDAG